MLKLVQHGFSVNEPIMDCGINLIMHAASSQCSADQFAQLLNLGPDLNARDRVGRTVLHFACRAGNLDFFQQLIANQNIDVDAVTNAGVTPLMMAIESGNI